MGLSDRQVIFTGFLTDEQLQTIYHHAFVYVFPSYYEGFGLPPLEAMNWGIPVVSSNASCLKEILGEAPEYFNPYSIADITRTILKVVKDKKLRSKLIQKGHLQAKKFSWEKCARQTLLVYQKVLNKIQS